MRLRSGRCLRMGLVVVALVHLCTSSPASAGSSDAEARRLFSEGRAAYQRGRFEAALLAFQQGHRLSGRPGFLVNIGHCLRQLGQLEEAAQAFASFLASEPAPAVRAEVEGWLERLRPAQALAPAPPAIRMPVAFVAEQEEARHAGPPVPPVVSAPALPAAAELRGALASAPEPAGLGRREVWLFAGAGLAVVLGTVLAVLAAQPDPVERGTLATYGGR